jgi:hypothetical protein
MTAFSFSTEGVSCCATHFEEIYALFFFAPDCKCKHHHVTHDTPGNRDGSGTDIIRPTDRKG